ncbi:MAG: hypothetical protein AB9903_25600 [Vulcanimicrobiota bacterium]
MLKRISVSESSEIDYPVLVERCRVVSIHNDFREGKASGDMYKEAIKSYCRFRLEYFRHHRCFLKQKAG